MTVHAPPTTTVKGRYRRSPAAWLWLALLLVPLLLAALGGVLRPDTTTPGAETSSDGATPAVPAAAEAGVVEVGLAGGSYHVSAVVPDEAARTALLDDVRGAAGDVEVVDNITVQQGAEAVDTAGLAGFLSDANARFTDLNVRLDGQSVQLSGSAPAQDAVDELKASAGKAFPGLDVSTDLAVGTASGAADAALSCDNLTAGIDEQLNAHPVVFEVNSATVSAQSRSRLTAIGEAIASCQATGVEVQGHTDASGTEAVNQALSQRRAESVAAVLVSAGVDRAEVTAKGYGSSKTISKGDSPAETAKDRRVEILVEGGAR